MTDHPVEEQTKLLHRSLDKILATHRNTRFFLFMLTGPFYVLMTLFKSFIKFFVIVKLYKKKKEYSQKKQLQAPA